MLSDEFLNNLFWIFMKEWRRFDRDDSELAAGGHTQKFYPGPARIYMHSQARVNLPAIWWLSMQHSQAYLRINTRLKLKHTRAHTYTFIKAPSASFSLSSHAPPTPTLIPALFSHFLWAFPRQLVVVMAVKFVVVIDPRGLLIQSRGFPSPALCQHSVGSLSSRRFSTQLM